MLKKILAAFSNDTGIDLGTANTLVYAKGRGIILNEPSVVAVEQNTRNVLAVGEEARNMLGRTPGNIVAVRPLREGVIADFRVTEAMLRYFIKKGRPGGHFFQPRPRIVIGVPTGITPVERRAVIDAASKAGAREVYLVTEPMAAAIGVGLPVQEPSGNMIIDIGGGTTDVAIISLAGIVASKSIRVAGDKLTESITHYLKNTYSLMVGERTAETIKIQIGSAYHLPEEIFMSVKGRDMITGLPKTLTINSEEIRQAMADSVAAIVSTVRNTLDACPPEIAADLVDKGVVLAGGGALLKGLDFLLKEKTGLNVIIADDPLTAVARGAGKVLEQIEILKKIVASDPHQRSS